MTTARKIVCTYCRRRRVESAIEGSRCKDRDSCRRAMVRRISSASLPPAEAEAIRMRKRQA